MGEATGAAVDAATAIHILPRIGRFVFRGRADAVAAVGDPYGVGLPRQACRAALAGTRTALWLGPDEWLLLLPESEAESCAAALSRALAGFSHSLVDISHRHVGLQITG